MESVVVLKIGGNIIDDEAALASVLDQFADLSVRKILVHGGGKSANELAAKLQIPQTVLEGRRVTDSETLKIAVMVYAGLINKNLVAQLQKRKVNALGVTGADGNLILAKKREVTTQVDFGWVGDVSEVNLSQCAEWLNQSMTLVVAPITHDGNGALLNTNADTIARELAKSLSKQFHVSLIFAFERSGVLQDVRDDSSRLSEITPSLYQKLKSEEKIFSGMIPKLDNAFAAIAAGVDRVVIGRAENFTDLLTGKSGTLLKRDLEKVKNG